MYTGYDFSFIGKEVFQFTEYKKNTFDIKTMNILTYTVDQIKQYKHYIYIWLDEYHLSCHSIYQKQHHRHISLLYGIDEEKNCFIAYTLDQERNFTKMEIAFCEIEDAFLSGLELCSPTDDCLIVFQFKDFKQDYPFRLDRFIHNLADYIYSYDKFDENYFHLWPIYHYHASLSYGMNAYRKLIELYQKREYLLECDLNNIQFMYEQKKGLLTRLNYVYTITRREELVNFIDQYKEIVIGFTRIKNIYLKGLYLLNDTLRNYDRLVRIKNDLLDKLTTYLGVEFAILEKIILILRSAPKEEQNWPDLSEYIEHDAVLEINRTEYPYRYHTVMHFMLKGKKIVEIFFTPIIESFIEVQYGMGKQKSLMIDELFSGKRPKMEFYEEEAESLKIHIFTDVKIDGNDIHIGLREKSLLQGNPVSASSSWQDENPGIENSCQPQYALDGRDDTFWNSCMDWKKGEYLEVSFCRTVVINCLLVKERAHVRRIREYAIEYLDVCGKWIEIIHFCGCLEDRAQIHHIQKVEALKLKLVIWDSTVDLDGNSEPAVARFEAYHIF